MPGFRTILTGDVTSYTNNAMKPMYQRLLPSIKQKEGKNLIDTDFDWALHPEGATIITGVQEQMKLSNEQLRATKEIYKTRGNSSSPTTVIVLDKLRTMGKGRDYVVAAAVGPGLNIEMSILRRCRENASDEDF
jgi:type III polyketide synthase